MTNGNNIEHKIDEVLSSLDNIRPATANPFLYTRIKARLQQKPESVWNKIFMYLARPSVAMTMIILVIVGDGMLLFMGKDTSNSVSAAAPEYSLSVQYQEYSLDNQAFYHYAFDEVTPEPQSN
jgi:hypothetical protein